VYFEEVIDRSLQHERIVDRDVSYIFNAIPAGLSSPRDGSIHHVICDEEVGLEELDTPSQDGSLEEFLLSEGTTL
jgi:hypothetical protein